MVNFAECSVPNSLMKHKYKRFFFFDTNVDWSSVFAMSWWKMVKLLKLGENKCCDTCVFPAVSLYLFLMFLF